jgi:xylose isomerase
MRTYLILKEKAARFNADKEIQDLIAAAKKDDGSQGYLAGGYTKEKAARLRAETFDRTGLGARGLAYERLDQLTIELLLGVR